MQQQSVMQQHISLLGMKVVDKVTGFKGVVTTMSFDLYRCIQAAVSPSVDKEGKVPNGQWFDVTRLKIKSRGPVMKLPDFSAGYVAEGKKGASEKPLRGL